MRAESAACRIRRSGRDRCRPAGGEDPLFAAEPGGGEAAWAERTRAICGEIFLGGVWQEYVGVL